MEVQQLQTVEHVHLAQPVHHRQDLGHGEAKLGPVPRRNPPAATALGAELGPHPQHGANLQALAGGDRQLHLVHLLNHNDWLLPQALAQHGGFNVVPVLVAVADQQGPGGVEGGQGNQEFGFRSGLQAKLVGLAKPHHVLQQLPLLVTLDRKYPPVDTAVLVTGDRLGEAGVNPLDAVLQDI